ncbi:2OG-Fe(II) oxygenase [Sulfurimonas sp.]|uniref:2OG-Fe(II) oxygenase n=1 Tax=Sulfurimonas sp. TaxID=2022749 RepID=UPI002AB2A7AC|nr:2OG-Fe(II) oxygenase [Sulfurimonas sp.]
MYEKLYSQITDALVNDGYVVITNALEKELPLALFNEAKNEQDFKKAGISSLGDLHLDSDRRRDKISWLSRSADAQGDFLDFTSGLQEYLNRELYLGLSYYESHFAIYEEGDFYETHLDCFKNSKNRVVTTVYYLNEDWNDNDGGELVVYDEDDNFLAKVKPDANTLIVFMSEKFPHEVLPAKRKRYSIAGWFRIDKV